MPVPPIPYSTIAMIFAAVVTMFGSAVTFLKWLSLKKSTSVFNDEISCNKDKIRDLEIQLNDIHEWLSLEDSDGVKKIYSRSSRDDEVKRLGDLMRELTPAMMGLANAVTRLREDL